jgi:hypothetical protein
MTRDHENLVATMSQIERYKEKVMKECEEADRDCKFSMFADTLVISSVRPSTLLSIWCHTFFLAMLRDGMPLRGAIAKGDFVHEGNLYGGAALTDAHELAESLDFAGCVLAPSAEELAAHNMFKLVNVPIKSVKGSSKCKMYVLQLADLELGEAASCRNAVRRSFEGHGKKIGPTVLSKFTNTVDVLLEEPIKPPDSPSL